MNLRLSNRRSAVRVRLALARALIVASLLGTLWRQLAMQQSAAHRLPQGRRSVLRYARLLPELRGTITDRCGRVVARTRLEDGKDERSYPYGASLANLVGVAGHRTGDCGLESFLTTWGQPVDSGRSMSDALLGDRVFTVRKIPDVQLTVDAELQTAIYNLFEQANRPGCAVLMNRQGELLTVVSYPSFDPARLMDSRESNYRADVNSHAFNLQRNRATIAIPVGSTIKPIIFTIRRITAGDWPPGQVYCPGWIRVHGELVHCHRQHGQLDHWQDAIIKSCNVASVRAIDSMTPETTREGLARFGLFNTTVKGLHLAPVSTRLLQDEASQVYVGIGALEITPIALCRAYAAIFFDGELPEAHLLRSISGSASNSPGSVVILQPEISRAMKDALRDVVREGTAANISDSPLMGKTGTAGAKVAEAEIGNSGVFAWAAPYPQPQVCGVVVFEGQQGVGFHGRDAAVMARHIYELYRTSASRDDDEIPHASNQTSGGGHDE